MSDDLTQRAGEFSAERDAAFPALDCRHCGYPRVAHHAKCVVLLIRDLSAALVQAEQREAELQEKLARVDDSQYAAPLATAGENEMVPHESCESCGRVFGNNVQVYVTLDDVWLCRHCYEAVPIRTGSERSESVKVSGRGNMERQGVSIMRR